jgi:hypothetical protein
MSRRSNGDDHVIVLSDEEDADSVRDDAGDPNAVVVSVDPGHQHCAVVRYDAHRDVFDRAALLDLVCRCKHSSSINSSSINSNKITPWTLASTGTATRKGKHPKVKPPTIEELPEQFCRLMDHSPLAQEMFGPCALLAVERQMPDNTRMMVVSAALRVHCRSVASRGLRILAPSSTKHFWNKAAQATETALCFRPKAGHSKHKTDAKRMAPRIMTGAERFLFRRAAERNAAHQVHCPAHRALQAANEAKRKRATDAKTADKSRKRRKQTIKTDDLMDAALQAIFAAQKEKGQKPDDSTGPAYHRLWRTRQQNPLLQYDNTSTTRKKTAKTPASTRRTRKSRNTMKNRRRRQSKTRRKEAGKK